MLDQLFHCDLRSRSISPMILVNVKQINKVGDKYTLNVFTATAMNSVTWLCSPDMAPLQQVAPQLKRIPANKDVYR